MFRIEEEKVFVYALTDIQVGDELFIDYGKNYWLFRKQRFLELAGQQGNGQPVQDAAMLDENGRGISVGLGFNVGMGMGIGMGMGVYPRRSWVQMTLY